MFLFKRKVNESDTQVVVTRTVELGRDTIVLGSSLIEGEQEGNLYVEDLLTIGADACIVGNITVTRCIIEGRVVGDVVCAEDLQLSATAVIKGVVMAKTVAMEAGCVINGKVVLDPNLKVSILPLKIAEARDYLVKEGADLLSGLTKKIEGSKQDSNILKNITNESAFSQNVSNHDASAQNRRHQIVSKQSSVYSEPVDQSDNWW